jgi:hypothetical protein
MASRSTCSCRRPATQLSTTPAILTSGSSRWHPSTSAAAVRVIFVAFTTSTTGA